MVSRKLFLSLLCMAMIVAAAPMASAITIPTNFGGGADAEVRESNPSQERGNNTEIATRVRNNITALEESITGATTDRSSMYLLRFDIRGLNLADAGTFDSVSIRTTHHTGNLAQNQETTDNNGQGRLSYTFDPDLPDPNDDYLSEDTYSDVMKADDNGDEITFKAGLEYHAILPGHAANKAGTTWVEDDGDPNAHIGIAYDNAPAILPDNNIGTFDVNPAETTFLGVLEYPDIGTQNHLAVGDAMLFSLPSLKSHLIDALTAGDDFINVWVHSNYDDNDLDNDTQDDATSFVNFNWIVNPKEKTTLRSDGNYDADINDPNNATGSPWSEADNSTGLFSPSLIIIPEPGTLVLSVLAGLASLTVARRRK